jgi:hypothetical protein
MNPTTAMGRKPYSAQAREPMPKGEFARLQAGSSKLKMRASGGVNAEKRRISAKRFTGFSLTG